MTSSAIEAFALRAIEAEVIESEFEALCSAEGVTDLALFDALARQIALGYNGATWSFEQADVAMNRLWALLTSRATTDGWEIPKYFYAVYEAFDAGEYHHSGDAESVDPEMQYTRPLIAALLSK